MPPGNAQVNCPHVRLLVDGYNILHAWPELKRLLPVSLEYARDSLVERLSVYQQINDVEVFAVFDARRVLGGRNSADSKDGVTVIFSRGSDSADHVIERLAYQALNAGEMVEVATSDRTQRDLVRGMGGAVIDAIELQRRVVEAEAQMERNVKRYQQR